MREQLNRTIVGLVALMVISSPLLVTMPHYASAASSLGIMIPLYTYPTDGTWTAVINAKNAHPSVPIVVIADISGSGAGSSSDPNFVTGINNMKAAGITVIGYVDTAYGSRSISQVKTEINNWSNWYHVNGIFFDEMDNSAGGESYYSTATSYAKSLGMTMTVGNPGTSTDSSYIGTVDNIVIYETTGTPSLSTLLSYTFNGLYSKSNFSFIAYSVSSLPSASYLASAANDVSYIYITNAGGSNPYDVLPSYFSTEVADLDTGSGSTATVPSAPTGLTANTGNAQAVLSWIAPSSNGGSAISGYNVYRGTTSGGENTTPIATGIASTTYTDTGLTNGQVYYYVVKAVNSIGTSSSSNEANVTPVTSVTAPSAPTGLTANAASSSQINLNWTAPTNNGGSAITGYKIDRSIDGGTTWSNIVSNTASTSTTYTDTNLSSSTTYTYQVSSINSVGTSLPSNTVSATTGSGGGTTTGNIVLNNVQSTSGTVSSSYKITLSNFNVGTGNDRLLVVGVSANNNNVASITFGGVPLTMKTSSFYNNDAEFWYLKNPTGTGNIVVTMAGPTQVVVGAYSFSGVNQTSPLPTAAKTHNTSANSPHVSINAKYANDLVLDLSSIYGGVTLGSPTCTQEWNANVPSAITGASSSTIVQSPGSLTCSWTASSPDLWDDVAVEINADTASTTIQAPSGTLNNVQSTSGTVSSSYKITLSNFNVGTGNDRLLVVGVSANNNNVASITFGGVPLAMKTSSFYNNDAEFWYLKNPTGTGNIVVTMAGPTQVVVGAYSFSGVNQTSPLPNSVIRHNTAASSPSISLTTTYPNDLVLDLPSIYGGTTLNSSTCSQQWDVNMPSAITGASSSTLLQSPAAVTCGWTASGGGDLWDDAAVEIMTDTQ